jgi:response regulator NasT
VAENGRQLIECCRETRPDIVITDIKMPDIDGIEAAMQICDERPIPIILVSAYQDPELIERAEADHVMAYLVKPISQAHLQPAIALAMRRFEEMQALRREADDLKQALADRKMIEKAKGVLMNVTGISENDAFRRLQQLAADGNQKLIDAGRTILSLEKTLRPPEGKTAHPA